MRRNKGCVLLLICAIVLLIIILIMSAEDVDAGIPDIGDLFPEVIDDLSKVSWAHAVNSKKDLERDIADDSIMMLEADILPGHLEGDDTAKPVIPIMAHPPNVLSDISFEMWIDAVIKANQEGQKKGAKLDFKDVTIVEDCLKILQDRKDQIIFPLWLNADILKGPVNATREPVDANKFLKLCVENFPLATLSVGWTTAYTTADDEGALYTKEMTEEMSSILEANNVDQPVTFPIRAAFVPHSIKNLELLLDNVPYSTITVWSSLSDTIDVQALLNLRDVIGHEFVYYDLPGEQKKEFDEAKDKKEAESAKDKGASLGGNIFPPNALAAAGVALASALAALYLYN